MAIMKRNVNHYKWLEKHLNDFWISVFGKDLEQTGCSGIIVSHGDKGMQYKSEWDKHGISFPHGMAVYLLTYTSELGDTPKHLSCQWVIENYEKYKSYLPDIDVNDPDILSFF